MADYVWPEDSGTGASEDDYADAANFAAHRHTSIATDYVEEGMSLSVDHTNETFSVSSGMCFISDSSASLAQANETRDDGVTYGVGIDSRSGKALADTAGLNDIIVAIDPADGPDNVVVTAISEGTIYGDPHIVIGVVDAANDTSEEVNRRPHLNFGGGEVQNHVYAENFDTLQAAIDHAEDNTNPYYNGIVYVPPGVYNENLTIHRRTKLVGNATRPSDYPPGDTVLTGTITTPEHNDSANNNSFAIGFKNITFDGATVNLSTGSSTCQNIMQNVSLRETTSMTLEGRVWIVDGVTGTYSDGSTLTFGDTGNGTDNARGGCIRSGRNIDVTVDSPYTWIANLNGNSSVTVNGNYCDVSSIQGPVDINASGCRVGGVDGTVTLNGTENTAAGISGIDIQGNRNTVQNVTGTSSISVSTHKNHISGVAADVTVGGDDNSLNRITGNITLNGTNNVVTASGEWDSGAFAPAYSLDIDGIANHVKGTCFDISILSGGQYSSVVSNRGSATVDGSDCTLVHITGGVTDNSSGTTVV